MKPILVAFALVLSPILLAQKTIYSGPQKGEAVKPFKAFGITGPDKGKEVEALKADIEKPLTIVFVHSIERSMLPLLRIVDTYAGSQKEKMKTVIVFLGEDRLALENRLPQVAQSIKLQNPMLLSLDGIEGPGSYGLNKECLMTIVAADKGKVTANFALVQPGITDGPKVIEALAKTAGDPKPPSMETLTSQLNAGNAMTGRGMNQELDLNKLDTSTPEAMARTIKQLVAEIEKLRAENSTLKKGQTPTPPLQGRPPLPGAAPTDEQLVSLLRQFIRPGTSDENVDNALKGMEDRMKGNDDLKKQAVNGLIRVLHLKYGTEYAHKAGKAFVEKHNK